MATDGLLNYSARFHSIIINRKIEVGLDARGIILIRSLTKPNQSLDEGGLHREAQCPLRVSTCCVSIHCLSPESARHASMRLPCVLVRVLA